DFNSFVLRLCSACRVIVPMDIINYSAIRLMSEEPKLDFVVGRPSNKKRMKYKAVWRWKLDSSLSLEIPRLICKSNSASVDFPSSLSPTVSYRTVRAFKFVKENQTIFNKLNLPNSNKRFFWSIFIF